ncbi:synaptonemal complex protein 1 [Conger conger]|uniref:synaptonemal complex protein 1 n=1 Tax=Conger conger TaxID=82655 RepID=UPI002A59BDC1|nr:synaptonemal complex protein 1 [Conger conger]
MVEEKDAELEEKRKREAEIKADKLSLELEMSELKIHHSDLKKQLDSEIKEKEKVKQEVTSLSKKIKALKEDSKHKAQHPPTPVVKPNGVKITPSPKTSSVKSRRTIYDFTNEQENECCEAQSNVADKKVMVTPQQKVSESGTLKTSRASGNKAIVTPRMKSYRIRTPPSPGKCLLLGRSTLELDPKSDSSELNDSLSFSAQSGRFKRSLRLGESGPLQQQHGSLHKKPDGPAEFRSPGAALKLAAVKRMRDAGWTAVTNSDKRKKNGSEKIFA